MFSQDFVHIGISCLDIFILLVLEFMLSSRMYLIPFLEYSCLDLVRCEFFTGGRVFEVRADPISLFSLKFLFVIGFAIQRFSF